MTLPKPPAVTARYEPAIDLDAITMIDVHTHVEADDHGHLSNDQELLDAAAAYFRGEQPPAVTVDDLATYFRERKMAAVVFTVDHETETGHPPLSSEEIAAGAAKHNDVLIPFGSVDPRRPDAVERAIRLIADHGCRGLKFHPSMRGFAPNDQTYYPLWEAMADHGAILLSHTGQTGIGAGLPGGRGIKLRYSDPMLLDDVAADFPDLRIILAHPSVPWADSSIAMATHKSNVYVDLSGWLPKYFPPQLVRALNGPLRGKALFGSDFPLLTPDRWLASFATLGVKVEILPAILKDTAAGLLGLR
ncbi:amidohydrolase family protein [Streptomyces sp. NPDC091215]|uniref:amidohydrolase family protein n=1 Tax=Streptomyces sp. NPDC091215 TaxID=3155192 RepID=UPI0034423833